MIVKSCMNLVFHVLYVLHKDLNHQFSIPPLNTAVLKHVTGRAQLDIYT